MIPNSVFGLLVIAASLGPGYLFVLIAEKRRPRAARSNLLEIAELIAVGGSSSIVTLLLALLVAKQTGWVDLRALSNHGTEYALTHPLPVFGLLLALLGGSYLLAGLFALAAYRKSPATLRKHSVWHELLQRRPEGAPFATVELRDGRTVAGPVAYYTVQEAAPEEREVVLISPIKARANRDAPYMEVVDTRVVLRASDVVALSVKYFRDGS